MTTSYRKSVLPAGITVLSEAMPDRRSVSVGAWVRNGARDEPPEWLGVSHFIEHMMFKGTEQRDARAIAQSLESLGGHLDAFTGREQVCYYARALADHLPQVLEVLADIVCASRLDEPEVSRERNVVREEIRAAEDSPDDSVLEMLSSLVWGEHALGQPILGRMETLDALTPAILRHYFQSRYRPEQLLIAAAGGLEHDEVVRLVEQYFRPPSGPERALSDAPPPFRPEVRHERREDLQQLYLSLGTRGASYASEERVPLVVLNTLLGGGMSSRLFQTVREEAGLAYSISSSAEFHRDGGMVSIHLAVAPDKGDEALDLVRRELDDLTTRGPNVTEVEAAKAQIRGSLVMGQESVSSRMFHFAQEEIYCGGFTDPELLVAKIGAVTLEQVAELAVRYLPPAGFAVAALGPKGAPEVRGMGA
jgi:predicted Zn-dependent peptidase